MYMRTLKESDPTDAEMLLMPSIASQLSLFLPSRPNVQNGNGTACMYDRQFFVHQPVRLKDDSRNSLAQSINQPLNQNDHLLISAIPPSAFSPRPPPLSPSSSQQTHNPIQITLITTSNPLLSPPSNLNDHIPSVLSFQNAPVAECMPRRPTCNFSSLPSDIGLADEGEGLFKEDVGTRCWIIVLLTVYLYEGEPPPAGEDSLIRDLRID